jgi:hypothetical protein
LKTAIKNRSTRSPIPGFFDSRFPATFRRLIRQIHTVIIRIMNARQRKSPVTDLLRRTIAESGIPYNQLEQATGVHRASIMRFLRGHSMRLDLAERLMVYLGLEVRKRK